MIDTRPLHRPRTRGRHGGSAAWRVGVGLPCPAAAPDRPVLYAWGRRGAFACFHGSPPLSAAGREPSAAQRPLLPPQPAGRSTPVARPCRCPLCCSRQRPRQRSRCLPCLPMSAIYSIYTSPNHAPIPNHLPTLIVTPYGQPHHTLYSYIHTNYNKECYLLTPSPQGDLCVAKMLPPPGSRGLGVLPEPGHGLSDRSVRCEASRNLRWSISNTGIHAPVYKLTLPNPDQPGSEQPLFQISKPNPHAHWWTLFYFTYAGHLIPPKRLEFGKIQKSSGSTGGTRVTITGKTPEEKAVWQTLGEGNEDMVEWIVLCAALNVLDDEIIKAAAEKAAVDGLRPAADAVQPNRSSTTAPTPQAPANSVPRNAGPSPQTTAPPTQFAGRPVMPPAGGRPVPAGYPSGRASAQPTSPPPQQANTRRY